MLTYRREMGEVYESLGAGAGHKCTTFIESIIIVKGAQIGENGKIKS